ncbi:MAG: hypothetical protein ACRDSZ_25730 [Pseudonocardiaceae bacterium]
MAAHQRMMPLLCLLVRLGWQRDPDLWTVRCRDGHGRRARLRVRLTATGVSIEAPLPGPAQLTPWQAGQLRVALRDANLCFGELAGPEPRRTDLSCPDPARLPPGSPPVRERVRLLPATARLTVAQIAHRLATSPTPEPEADPDDPDDGRPMPEWLRDLDAARPR